MASYICSSNDNWNTGSTWHLVDANSLLDSEAGSSEPGTAYTASSNFTVAAADYDGVSVKLAAAGTGAYTVSLQIYDVVAGAAKAGTEVTINRGDLCSATAANNEGGWVFFKFGSPVALAAANNYRLEIKESNAGADVLFYRDATANNWSRMLRTTTDAASPPAAASILHIMEEKTGAGAATTRTVTMDAIAGSITKYGSGTDGTVALTISDGGTLNYDNDAATNFYLQLDGNLIVYNGGTLTIGTTGTAIPRDSTAVLEFDPTADGGMGLIIRNGGTFTAQGLSRTTGKNVVSCLLNTDEAVNQTELGVNTDTGWLDNDAIAVASTTRTYSQCETGLLNGAAAAAALTVDGFGGAGGGLAYAHSGTTPTQAEVILLTRNVKVRSTSATVMTYCNFKATSVVDIDWVEFYYLGENASDKKGIEIGTTTGSCNIAYSSLWNVEDAGIYIVGSTSNNITISYNTFYNVANQIFSIINTDGTTAVSITIDHNIALGIGATSGFALNMAAGTVTNNTIVGMQGKGIVINNSSSTAIYSGNVVHSCASYGIDFESPVANSTFGSITIWRCNTYGVYFNSNRVTGINFNNFTLFGNNTANIYFNTNTSSLIFDTLISDSETGYTTTDGISNANNIYLTNINILNSIFSGAASGVKIAHTDDINISTLSYAPTYATFYLNKTKLTAANEVITQANWSPGSFVKSTMHDQTTGAALIHKSWFKYGTIITDLTVFNTATPSMKMTPNTASPTYNFASGSFKVNVNSGETCTPSVYIRQSEAAEGDSANYNGSLPKLVVKRNDAVGITADTVLDTAAGAIGNPWEQLTGTTAAATDNGVMEFVVQCDGTTGFINVDDFTATVA